MDKYVWLYRSKEWIEKNPNKGTMYKALVSDIKKDTDISSLTSRERFKIKNKTKKVVAGTYLIVCEKSNSVYVGQSINVHSRLRQHKYQLLKEKNDLTQLVYLKMKNDIAKHGIDSFSFQLYEQIENATNEALLIKETELMHKVLSLGVNLYNTHIPFSPQFIYCPDNIKEKVKEFINELI